MGKLMYTPLYLDGQCFAVGEKASAVLSHAEIELVRAENRILVSPSSNAVHKALLRFEALMSSRVVTGKKIALLSLLRLEAALQMYPLHEKNNQFLEKLMIGEGLQDEVGLLETFRYMQTIDWISKVIKVKSVILPKTILNIHSRCLFGSIRRSSSAGFRACEYNMPAHLPCAENYAAPSPKDIPNLIEDYCKFVNKEILSPSAQAGVSHFQIECIHPFDDRLDNTERALSHVIFFKRGLLQSVIAPLALGPARSTEVHARYFVPHQVGMPVHDVNGFINSGYIFSLCAYYTRVAAQAMNYYLDTITKLEAHWRERVGKIERGSCLDLLLHELSGMPIVTVNSVIKQIGRSFSAAGETLVRLQKAGILEPIPPIQRNHAFVAREAVQVFEAIDKKIIPRSPIARDDIFV